MLKRIAQIYENHQFVWLEDKLAKSKLKKLTEREVEKNGKIKVAFVVQMPEVWDKEASIYEEMKNNNLFETSLLVVPSYNIKTGTLCEYGYEKEFFYKKYAGDNLICVINDDGSEIDIESYKFDYIFYPRPSFACLPSCLDGKNVIKHAKTCYVPYGYQGADVFGAGNTNKRFFRNIYLGFMDSEGMSSSLNNIFSDTTSHGLQNFLYLGYPVFDKYLSMKGDEQARDILWTPRWSFDPKIGGSHFMDYKEDFIQLKDRGLDADLAIRPHPLMWDNVIREGLMTQEEVEDYKKQLESNHIRIDANMMMEETVEKSKVLVTDFSSIIINYFMTGKPIIYCPFETELNEMYQKLLPGIYIANSWEEVEKYLDMIDRGEDVLYNVRREIIEKELKHLGGGTLNVINAIIDDFENYK